MPKKNNLESEALRWGDGPMGGDENHKISKFWFGPKIVPKGPFGVGMGPSGPKNPKESESGLKTHKIISKN